MGYSVINYLQIESLNGSIIADTQDYENAKELYEIGKANQITKLSKAELKLAKYLAKLNRRVSINEIVENYTKENGGKYSYQAIKKIIAGEMYKNKPGLIDKIPGMTMIKENNEYKYYLHEFKEFSGEVVSMETIGN
jgi:hypothetical protein